MRSIPIVAAHYDQPFGNSSALPAYYCARLAREDGVNRILAGDGGPTAFFCLSDSMAYGVYLAASRLGVSIPGDVSVLGYDDHQMSVLVAPPLTTFVWDAEGIVRAAVEQLVTAMDGWDDDADVKAPAAVTFAPTLVIRGSTGAPR